MQEAVFLSAVLLWSPEIYNLKPPFFLYGLQKSMDRWDFELMQAVRLISMIAYKDKAFIY